jgi:hypothetical protein
MFNAIGGLIMVAAIAAVQFACWLIPIWIGFEVLRAVGCV